MQEHSELTRRLDLNGLKPGDRFEIEPVNGKKKKIALKRTQFNFISRHFECDYMAGCFAVLPEMKNEKFNVQLSEVTNTTKTKASRKRYIAKVIQGGPFKLNGTFHNESYLEQGDKLEVGYNTIFFKALDQTITYGDSFLEKNRALINSELPILLQGETGVGKTRLAKKIHEQSQRPGLFVQINIAAYAKNLLESELFGHMKGAFTGAIADKIGVLKQANYGTLFIDEIDSLPMEIQTKLLLFLDDKKITPVGGLRELPLDVRLIFASGRDLKDLIAEAKMRKDFYFRLTSGATHTIPALRDQPVKLGEFCHDYCERYRITISRDLVSFYQTLPWPGNYRQLKGHLDQKRILASLDRLEFDRLDEILLSESTDLMSFVQEKEIAPLRVIKVAYAKKVFFQNDKNLAKSAALLDISTKCLKGMLAS